MVRGLEDQAPAEKASRRLPRAAVRLHSLAPLIRNESSTHREANTSPLEANILQPAPRSECSASQFLNDLQLLCRPTRRDHSAPLVLEPHLSSHRYVSKADTQPKQAPVS